MRRMMVSQAALARGALALAFGSAVAGAQIARIRITNQASDDPSAGAAVTAPNEIYGIEIYRGSATVPVRYLSMRAAPAD